MEPGGVVEPGGGGTGGIDEPRGGVVVAIPQVGVSNLTWWRSGPRDALSGVSSVSPVLSVVRLLRTAFTIVGISALVNGVLISSAGVSSASVSAPDSNLR